MFGISPTVLPTAFGSHVFSMERNSFTTRSLESGRGLLASRIRATSGLAGQLTILSYLATPEDPGEGHYDTAASTSNTALEDRSFCMLPEQDMSQHMLIHLFTSFSVEMRQTRHNVVAPTLAAPLLIDTNRSTVESGTREDTEKPGVIRVDVGFCFTSKSSKRSKKDFGALLSGHGFSQDCKFPEVSSTQAPLVTPLLHLEVCSTRMSTSSATCSARRQDSRAQACSAVQCSCASLLSTRTRSMLTRDGVRRDACRFRHRRVSCRNEGVRRDPRLITIISPDNSGNKSLSKPKIS